MTGSLLDDKDGGKIPASVTRPARGQLPEGLGHVVVVGNEKGGSGKSTTAMHLVVALLRDGWRVGTMDLDARQGTLSRYVANRQRFAQEAGLSLPQPLHRAIARSDISVTTAAARDERARFEQALAELAAEGCDYIVIDTPGSDTHLSRLGHAYADTLVTPLNDSFVDMDVLAQIDPETLNVLRPSTYAEMVWDQRKQRAILAGGSIDWIVMRNRLSHIEARNKQMVETALERLSQRIGFRLAPGFGERVIFRQLFLRGLTLLDLREVEPEGGMTMSHVAARQEVRALVEAIALKKPIRGRGRNKPAGNA